MEEEEGGGGAERENREWQRIAFCSLTRAELEVDANRLGADDGGGDLSGRNSSLIRSEWAR